MPDDEAPTAEPRVYRQGPYRLPAGATEILLVRHGESAPYEPGVPHPTLDGHGDPPLAEQGRLQAELLCQRLAAGRVDAIYVSPLRRTHETAAPLARLTGLVPVIEPDLREVHVGEWEAGQFRQHVRERDPIALEMFQRERWDVIPGAESNESLAARVRAAVERMVEASHGKRVVAVAHAGVIGTALSIAAKASSFAFVGAENASISVLVVNDGRWSVRRFNDTAHLDGIVEEAPDPVILES